MISVIGLNFEDQIKAFAKILRRNGKGVEVAVDPSCKMFIALNTLIGWCDLRFDQTGDLIDLTDFRFGYGCLSFLQKKPTRSKCYEMPRGIIITNGFERFFNLQNDLYEAISHFVNCGYFAGFAGWLSVLAYGLCLTSVVFIKSIDEMKLPEVPCYKYRFWSGKYEDIRRTSF